MGNFKITNKGLYWGLIITFGLLYVLVAFVSTLHAIDFFKLANITSLAILLGIAYEVGQATVLFSILMTKNKEKFLPWLLMILLTALQVTANVYASFKHMALSGNEDWTYWYTSILKIFGVQGGNSETYQVIISWISGALLPMVALGMTALVAQNIKLITEDEDNIENNPIPASDLISEISRVRPTEEDLETAETILSKKKSEKDQGYFEKEIPLEEKEDEKSTVIESPIKVTVDKPEEVDELTKSKNVVRELSDEEIYDMYHDEIEGDLPNDEEETSEPTTEVAPEIPIEEPVTEPTPDPPDPHKESEEERLERLRNIARENLKKK